MCVIKETICKIKNEYPELLDNRRRFAAILCDLIPNEKFDRNAILMAWDEGIIQEISKQDIIDKLSQYRFSKCLSDSYGIEGRLASSVILEIAEGFDKQVESVNMDLIHEEKKTLMRKEIEHPHTEKKEVSVNRSYVEILQDYYLKFGDSIFFSFNLQKLKVELKKEGLIDGKSESDILNDLRKMRDPKSYKELFLNYDREPKFEYVKIQGGYQVVNYIGDETNICIPLYHLDEPIISIAKKAFYKNLVLQKILIQENIKIIGESAFEGCENLERVRLQEGIERIENRAFANCPNLFKLELPISVTEKGKEIFV
jgi:hypothetical protein